MLNQTLPAAPVDDSSDVWIVDVVRTPLAPAGGALYEVQPSALLAGLLEHLCRKPGAMEPSVPADVLLVGTAVGGGVVADTAAWALARAGLPETVSTNALEGGEESGLDAIRLAAAQLRSGDANVAFAGAVHVPSRIREQRRVNPDALGAWAAQSVLPRVAADVTAALHGVVPAEVSRWVEAALVAGSSKSRAGVVPVLDLNGLTILADDAVDSSQASNGAVRELPQAHHTLARAVFPQLREIPLIHTATTDAPSLEGASLALLARADMARRLGWRPRARIVACAAAGNRRLQVGDSLQAALRRALAGAHWALDSIDRVVIENRFPGVQMAAARALELEPGQCALDPAVWWRANVGAVSPVLALDQLVRDMKASGQSRGALVACGDGGGVVAILVERGCDD